MKPSEITEERPVVAVREIDWMECDACGGPLKTMGHCKYLCQRCGFLRTCMDTV